MRKPLEGPEQLSSKTKQKSEAKISRKHRRTSRYSMYCLFGIGNFLRILLREVLIYQSADWQAVKHLSMWPYMAHYGPKGRINRWHDMAWLYPARGAKDVGAIGSQTSQFTFNSTYNIFNNCQICWVVVAPARLRRQLWSLGYLGYLTSQKVFHSLMLNRRLHSS